MPTLTRSLLRHEFKLTLALLMTALLALGLGLMGSVRPGLQAVWPAAAAGVALLLLKTWCRWQRERQLRELPVPQFLKRKLRETYPHLSGKDCDLVERGLRQFFIVS